MKTKLSPNVHSCTGFLAVACLVLLSLAKMPMANEAVIAPLKIKSYLDFGHLVNGNNSDASEDNRSIDMLPLNRGNVSFLQSVMLGEFFDVSVGVTGLIWWPFSEQTTTPNTRVMRVKPMVPLARAKWSFGESDGNHGHVQVGTFPYKYNFEAKNLGEYLYRSGTYPGFLWTTEGWLFMNRAGQYAHGIQGSFTHLEGKLKHNFSLFMEMVYYPIGDFSPGYDFAFKMPFFEIGGGVVFNHFIPVRPSFLEPDEETNIYVHIPAGNDPQDPAHVYEGPKDRAPSGVGDSVMIELDRWSHQGIKLMGRFTLNFNSVLPDGSSPDDFKFFTEVAVLGLKDYPLYYEKMTDRMPIMVGVNIPTFGLLNTFSVQLEHYSSPYNNFLLFNEESDPRWDISEDLNTYLDSSRAGNLPAWKANTINDDDNIKWSIYLKKNFNQIFTLYTQVASDHFRLMDEGLKATPVALTSTPKEWYYLFRLEFNIH